MCKKETAHIDVEPVKIKKSFILTSSQVTPQFILLDFLKSKIGEANKSEIKINWSDWRIKIDWQIVANRDRSMKEDWKA